MPQIGHRSSAQLGFRRTLRRAFPAKPSCSGVNHYHHKADLVVLYTVVYLFSRIHHRLTVSHSFFFFRRGFSAISISDHKAPSFRSSRVQSLASHFGSMPYGSSACVSRAPSSCDHHLAAAGRRRCPARACIVGRRVGPAGRRFVFAACALCAEQLPPCPNRLDKP